MADREVNFWGRIMTGLWRPTRLLNRIENGVLDGMPDSYIVIGGSQNWVELKAPIEPARTSTALFSGKHNLTITQRNWLLSHRQAGGRGWVAIETDKRVLLIRALHVDAINTSTVHQLIMTAGEAHWLRPMQESDWHSFANILTQKELP